MGVGSMAHLCNAAPADLLNPPPPPPLPVPRIACLPAPHCRDSKLTRILEDSLGGNCKTTFMAMVSPAVEAFSGGVVGEGEGATAALCSHCACLPAQPACPPACLVFVALPPCLPAHPAAACLLQSRCPPSSLPTAPSACATCQRWGLLLSVVSCS